MNLLKLYVIQNIKDPWNNDEHYRAGYLRAEEFLKERLFNI